MYYYFAYDVTMKHEKMLVLCPDSIFIGPVVVTPYTLVFDRAGSGDATANIVVDPGVIRRGKTRKVWGGLFTITESGLASLDQLYSHAYERRWVTVLTKKGLAVEAITYCRKEREHGYPDKIYFEEFLQGAADCELPPGYRRSLRRFRPREGK